MFEYFFCVLGIYACFLSWGVLQERVSTTPYGGGRVGADGVAAAPEFFRSFIVLNLCQAIAAAAVGGVYLKLRGQNLGPTTGRVVRSYLGVAVLNSLASPFGYAALKHIDYPTMILGKSCKLLPVMAAAVLVHRAAFPRYQVAAVALVTLGVSMFMLLHDQERMGGKKGGATKSNSLWGLFLLLINLAIDGLTNSTQDAMFKKFRITGQQMMVMMNLTSSALMAAYLAVPWVCGGELASAIAFVRTHPAVLPDILLFALCGALGQVFIFHTLGRFGSLTLVTITVTRKMFSIILSVVLYNHRLGLPQWACVLVVFMGIAVEAFGKRWSPAKSAPAKSEQVNMELSNESNGVLPAGTKDGTVAAAAPRRRSNKKKD